MISRENEVFKLFYFFVLLVSVFLLTGCFVFPVVPKENFLYRWI